MIKITNKLPGQYMLYIRKHLFQSSSLMKIPEINAEKFIVMGVCYLHKKAAQSIVI